MNIEQEFENVKIYNPKRVSLISKLFGKKGLTFSRYNALPRQSRDRIYLALERKIYFYSTNGKKGINLKEYLNGQDGFFAKHLEYESVVFIDGRFQFAFKELNENDNIQIYNLAKKLDSMPFICIKNK